MSCALIAFSRSIEASRLVLFFIKSIYYKISRGRGQIDALLPLSCRSLEMAQLAFRAGANPMIGIDLFLNRSFFTCRFLSMRLLNAGLESVVHEAHGVTLETEVRIIGEDVK